MGKTLLIMESPAKAKKVQGFLGSNYIVKSSVGHFREIPVPKNMTVKEKEKYGDYGIDVDSADFDALYKVSRDKSKVVKELKDALAKVDELVVFTDADNEGNAIFYHIMETLKPKVPTFRAVSLEITKPAILEGLKNRKQVDHVKHSPQDVYGSAESALTRASWDRLYGYATSPYVWRVFGGGSSGRVQTPGAKLVVEREMKRLSFKSVNYYTITAVMEGVDSVLVEYDGMKIAGGAQIDDDGVVKDGYLLITDENVDGILEELGKKDFVVNDVSSKPYRRTPPPPFTTSSALQSIGAKTNLGSKTITNVLQNLYVNSNITYIRTVSVQAAPESIQAAREALKKQYGSAMLHPTIRVYSDKSADNSGHECIRPVLDDSGGLLFKSFSDLNERKVFSSIYRRFLASQAVDCTGVTWTARFVSNDGVAVFSGSETIIDVEGWTKVYSSDD